MKKFMLGLLAIAAIAPVAFAGTETYSGKEMKQVAAPPPCPEWYADREFNVSIWGTYVFTGNEWANDRYIESDHAWGGGLDIKYFFARYFGIGIEGWAVDARRRVLSAAEFESGDQEFFFAKSSHESRAVGAALGTLTLRYPFHCSRFSPYIFGGGGAIFGGGQRDTFKGESESSEVLTTFHSDSETKAIGQVGGGLEIRITPHIGWINDFSWNFVDGPDNNFGMARSGINFAF
jgi:opacity protein-like surface antigen